MFIQWIERASCRLQLVLQGILKSPHCSTLLIHSTCLERQRNQAVYSLEFAEGPEMGCPTLSGGCRNCPEKSEKWLKWIKTH